MVAACFGNESFFEPLLGAALQDGIDAVEVGLQPLLRHVDDEVAAIAPVEGLQEEAQQGALTDLLVKQVQSGIRSVDEAREQKSQTQRFAEASAVLYRTYVRVTSVVAALAPIT